MFYRKYRPQKFSEISKPNETAEALANQIKTKKTGHAYLFIGSRGTGKTTTARILTKAINCTDISKDGDPCDKCANCKAITAGRFLDLIEIDAASNRGIDDIRSLKEKINLSPSGAKYKVYIIDEVHMLTMEAFNALLKTLEEPPRHAVFILCTTEGHKVPDTIKSRCQVFKFKRATIAQIVARLAEISKKEKFKIAKEDLEKIAKSSYGGFRDADTLLQQVIEGSIGIDSLLGASALDSFVKMTDCLIAGKTQGALEVVGKLFNDGVDLTNWGNEYVRYLRDLLFIQAGFEKEVSDVTDDVFADMEKQAFKVSSSELVAMIEKFMKAAQEVKSANIPQLPLELAVVEVSENKTIESSGFVVGDSEAKQDIIYVDSSDLITASFDSVMDKWSDVLKDIKPFNHSVEALLHSCRPSSLIGNTLIMDVYYAFHKERLETPKSREIVEKVLGNKFGSQIKVKYVLKSKEGASLTDKNVEPPKDVKIIKTAVEAFDGELII